MKNLTKLNITKPINGKQHSILAGKPTSIPNRGIYLLSSQDEEKEYSLWLIETDDDIQKMELWPYEGTDSEELIKELLEKFIETAFE
ncbi:MAG: hypothetical protein FWD13_12575 [Treponema sp.]|nr:hypothetical protein [Treponema sp.]